MTIQGDERPIVMTSLRDDPGVALELVEPLPSAELGTIAPGASASVVYRVKATDSVHAALEVLVTGSKDGETVRGLGLSSIKVLSDVLVELRVKLIDRPQWLAGQTSCL